MTAVLPAHAVGTIGDSLHDALVAKVHGGNVCTGEVEMCRSREKAAPTMSASASPVLSSVVRTRGLAGSVTSQRMVSARLAVAKVCPSGENATPVTPVIVPPSRSVHNLPKN